VTAYAERVLDALGDPTRRRVFKRLRGGARSVGEIAEGVDVSRPAVSRPAGVAILAVEVVLQHPGAGRGRPGEQAKSARQAHRHPERELQCRVELALERHGAAAIEGDRSEDGAGTRHLRRVAQIGSIWRYEMDLFVGPIVWHEYAMNAYPQTERTRVRRLPQRATFDAETVHAILDAGLVCTVSFVEDGRPTTIPTAYARVGDPLVFHGSAKSRTCWLPRQAPSCASR
jgi:DNA-binding transcriptional ArsR family regulator